MTQLVRLSEMVVFFSFIFLFNSFDSKTVVIEESI